MDAIRLLQRLRGAPDTAPVFVVAAPCAGAARLARLLAQAEGTTPRRPADRLRAEQLLGATDRSSDRLMAADATPERVAELRAALAPGTRRRVIDHAGVHALRVPFLAAAFPEARFVFLTRDPHEQVARMLAAWRSGRMVSYPTLPGWDGPWSLPLIPGWEGLRGRPLAEVVAAQWATITRLLLDDLAALPAGRWATVRYETLRDDLHATLPALARASRLRWTRAPRLAPVEERQRTRPDDLAAVAGLLAAEAELLGRLQALVAVQPVSRPVAAQLLPARLRRTLAGGTLAASLLGASLVPAPAEAATFTVTNLNDAGDGSLRDAIEDANAAPGADVITFGPEVSGTITLASELVISDSVDIQGPGAATVTVSGNDAVRVFYIYDGNPEVEVAVRIADITISDGLAQGANGGLIVRDQRAQRDEGPRERAVGDVRPAAVTDPNGAGILSYGVDLTLDGVTMTGNNAEYYGGALHASGATMDLTITGSTISGNSAVDGAGIYVEDLYGPAGSATVTIEESSIADNTASDDGGGVSIWDEDAALTISDSTITGNEGGTGGGIFTRDTDAPLTIERTTIADNSASTGAGVYLGDVTAATTISASTISGNDATGEGGGVYLYNSSVPVVIESSTISGNTAVGAGGGVYVYGYSEATLELRHSTVASNTAATGGGVAIGGGSATLDHTIVADNTATTNADLDGGFDATWSLIETPGTATITGSNNITGQDPQLGPLQDNGGPTQTHVPAPGSPAVNAGDPAFAPPPATDQRGQPRVVGGRIDIGAVEVALGGTFALAADSLTVNEAAGTATINVTRSGGSSGAVAVDYVVTAGTATAGEDFTVVSGTLSWASGDTAPKTITIPIVNDNRAEPNETFTVTISNATGGAALGAPTTATITIEDNDYNVFLPIVWT